MLNSNRSLLMFTMFSFGIKMERSQNLQMGTSFWKRMVNYGTPPIDSGLLAGSYREMLLATGKIHEKVLTIEDVKTSHKIWFINSIRKWVEVQLV